jgi:hypothetical protein
MDPVLLNFGVKSQAKAGAGTAKSALATSHHRGHLHECFNSADPSNCYCNSSLRGCHLLNVTPRLKTDRNLKTLSSIRFASLWITKNHNGVARLPLQFAVTQN